MTRFPETGDRTLLFNHSTYTVELVLVSSQNLARYCILPQEACVSAKEPMIVCCPRRPACLLESPAKEPLANEEKHTSCAMVQLHGGECSHDI